MRVKKIYNRVRRDCWVDLECESCGHTETCKSAYDDRNFWDNVIPDMHCENCGKSSKNLKTEIKYIETKYPEGMLV